MAISLKGDQEITSAPTTKSKALRINLNSDIYGTFAEIGAGQETARNFFRSGAASGTIAKAMSAYDKDFSDAIYGIEEDKRYVTQPRLKKMLRHEIDLMEDRLSRSKHPDKLFFSYANTVTTIDFAKKFKGHGWIGIRFQLDPLEDYNEIIVHIRFKETDARLQQETLGTLGVNLIYGAFYLNDNPKELVKSLYDNLSNDQLEIDMINFSGPRFMYVDNRLMSLQLLKNGMTNAVMFGPDGNNLLPAQVLYKKNILALRGSFRPVTKVNMDMYEKSKKLFLKEKKVKEENTQVIFEITLSNLSAMNPMLIFQAFMSGSQPDCQEITLETIDVKNKRGTETRHVTVTDIKNMNPCSFGKKNPVTGQKCKEAFGNITTSQLPDDFLVKLFYASLGIGGVYLLINVMKRISERK